MQLSDPRSRCWRTSAHHMMSCPPHLWTRHLPCPCFCDLKSSGPLWEETAHTYTPLAIGRGPGGAGPAGTTCGVQRPDPWERGWPSSRPSKLRCLLFSSVLHGLRPPRRRPKTQTLPWPPAQLWSQFPPSRTSRNLKKTWHISQHLFYSGQWRILSASAAERPGVFYRTEKHLLQESNFHRIPSNRRTLAT